MSDDSRAARAVAQMTAAAEAAREGLAEGDGIDRVRAFVIDAQKWAGMALEDLVEGDTRQVAKRLAPREEAYNGA